MSWKFVILRYLIVPSQILSFIIQWRQHPILNKYKIKSKEIKEVAHAKYLGVTISHNLTWSEHIKQITTKANRTKGFLQRNLHNCPPETKVTKLWLNLYWITQPLFGHPTHKRTSTP